MKKFSFSSAALLLIISLIAVSCTPNLSSGFDDKLVRVSFDAAEDKAVDADSLTTVSDTTWGASFVEVGNVNDYYWSYSAVKNDGFYKTGETYGFAYCAVGTGLGGVREFSAGAWIFTLKAYSTAEDRATAQISVFEGSMNADNLKEDSSIAVPVDYTYDLGVGTANFEIDALVVQNAVDGVTDTRIVSKVEAVIGNETVMLTKNEGGTTWTGSATVASGRNPVYINVYLDDETEPVTSEVGKAIIMNGVPTAVTGTMAISLSEPEETDSKISSTFYPVLPETQPDDSLITDVEVPKASQEEEETETKTESSDSDDETESGGVSFIIIPNAHPEPTGTLTVTGSKSSYYAEFELDEGKSIAAIEWWLDDVKQSSTSMSCSFYTPEFRTYTIMCVMYDASGLANSYDKKVYGGGV